MKGVSQISKIILLVSVVEDKTTYPYSATIPPPPYFLRAAPCIDGRHHETSRIYLTKLSVTCYDAQHRLLRCIASIINNFFDVAFTGLLELFTFFVLRIMI